MLHLKKLSKVNIKTKHKITPALQKSISIKKSLTKKFINAKEPEVKTGFTRNIKTTEACCLQY